MPKFFITYSHFRTFLSQRRRAGVSIYSVCIHNYNIILQFCNICIVTSIFGFELAVLKAPNLLLFESKSTWEQRKLEDTVLIERGGSPRPIEEFITEAADGLNWVKIGDAPNQGNYITKTSEKIKPSGLTKTRQVEPGDLILSNSMSFGKPYIMAINGCIHDGWLLIRNTQGLFDLKFLCCLLETEQMLIQYRASAAGSTVNNLNKELVGNTTVKYPLLPEQMQLGTFFSTIDRLIALHQRKRIVRFPTLAWAEVSPKQSLLHNRAFISHKQIRMRQDGFLFASRAPEQEGRQVILLFGKKKTINQKRELDFGCLAGSPDF